MNYMEKYNHKKVVATLNNDVIFSGIMHTNPKDLYNIQIEVSRSERILIPKHSILFLREVKE